MATVTSTEMAQEPPQELGHSVARGVLWAYLAFAASKGLVFASTIVLARLLTPAEFGIVGFATIITDYLDTLQGLGVGEALIQRKTRIEEAANATFVISIVTGAALFGLGVLLAPVAASFFNQPLVTPLLSVLAASYLFSSLGTVHDALLVKQLDFKQRTKPLVIRAFFKAVTSIGLAYAGYGVWALVFGQLASSISGTVTLWWIDSWRPSRRWDRRVAREVLGFGSQIILMGFLGNIEVNLDYLIIGKRLGEVALGLYTLAFRAPELLIINLVSVIADVAFPAFSKIQDDRPGLRRAILTGMHYIAIVAVPAGVGLAILSAPFIQTFYTDKWAGAIRSMQALALYASARAVTYNVGDVYKAIGRADVLNLLTMGTLVVLVPAMWVGADYGIFGVSVAHLVVSGLTLAAEISLMWLLLGVPPWSVSRTIWGPVVSTIGMALAMQGAQMAARPLASGAQFTLMLLVGIISYTVCAWLVNRHTIESLFKMALRAVGVSPSFIHVSE